MFEAWLGAGRGGVGWSERWMVTRAKGPGPVLLVVRAAEDKR